MDSVKLGDPFMPQNAARLRTMGWLTLIVQAIGIPAAVIGSWAASHIEGNADLDFGFSASGLLLALVFLTISWITGDSRWDASGSIVIGVLLVAVAALLATEIKSLIIGESAGPSLRPGLERIFGEEIPGGRVLRFIAIQTGSSEVLVSCKVSPGSITDVRKLIDSINLAERRARKEFPEIRWLFVEPDSEA